MTAAKVEAAEEVPPLTKRNTLPAKRSGRGCNVFNSPAYLDS